MQEAEDQQHMMIKIWETHGSQRIISRAEIQVHGEQAGKATTTKRHHDLEPEVQEIKDHFGRREAEDKVGRTQKTTTNTGRMMRTKNGMERITHGKEDMEGHMRISRCLEE